MPIITKATAKTFFETGDRPSETDFSITLDSTIFQPSSAGALTTGFVEVVSTAAATAWSSAGAIPVTTDTSAAVPRTLSARFGDVINVKDYGAIGDDSTKNDQAFADAEADRAALSWEKVHVPDGIFLVSAAPDWSRITGQGSIRYNSDLIPAGDINGNTAVTLNIPNAFASISDAWDYLARRTIKYGPAGPARVNVKLADGTYSIGETNLNHPQGGTIALIGNQTTPSNCVLEVTGSGANSGLVVSFGHSLGFLNGFLVKLPVKAVWPNSGNGILADLGSFIRCGTNMEVDNFYYGVQARYGSVIDCRSIKVDNAGDVGVFAFMGGCINAASAQSDNADDSINSLGSGFAPEWGGVLNAVNVTGTGNRLGTTEMLNDSALRTNDTAADETDNIRSSRNSIHGRGTNSVVDINILPKGAGSYVRFGSGYFATASVTADGIMGFKDGTGTIREFLVRTP